MNGLKQMNEDEGGWEDEIQNELELGQISPNNAKSASFNLGDGAANALAMSKDYLYVVVAGRNVFKILSVDDTGFAEKMNLRVGKNLNLNYSCNDVVWSPNDENLIATGATNGAVVLWNLSISTRAKQEHVFLDHQRTVHKVIFHPTEASILLSGSQDGTVKCFDIRLHEPKINFKSSNSESVRDIQFLPRNPLLFTSVSENGSVQLWDLRKPGERPYLTFTAHNGPVFSCDWHPEASSILATGGRDRAIKIWNVTNVATLEHTIQTVASVGRIKWRPNRKNHIGSTSLVVDSSVCVWDFRRPFVPFATFEKHKDVATGIAWRDSPHVFLSTSKDGMVWQNIFKDAVRPGTRANPQALALNSRYGEIVHAQAVTSYQEDNTTKYQIYKKSNAVDDNFHLVESRFFRFEATKLLDPFSRECAKRYILNGRSPQEMCEKNSQVALSLDIPEAALLWDICKVFCLSLIPDEEVENGKPTETSTPPKDDQEDHGHLTDDDPNNSSSETEKQDILLEIASGLHLSQNLFMSPGPTIDFNYDSQQDWQILPVEAFQPRHEIREGSSPPIHLEDCSPREMEEPLETVAIENRTSQLRIKDLDPIPDFDIRVPLTKALHYHASKGDVQTAVSVWLVLQQVYQLDIPTKKLESWCLTYVELLQRHRLFCQAALIIKLSGESLIGHLSQESTTYLISCGRCSKVLRNASGNYCDRCEKAVSRCVICGEKVAGLMQWCQGCGHGGHYIHLSKWFSGHNECPTGCGHFCNGG